MSLDKTVQAKTKCDQVVDEILTMITKGVYSVGDKLPPEQYFVEYFGVSRVTVRESFKKLNMLGVVTIKQGEGTYVNKVDLGTLMQPLFSAIVLGNLSIHQIYEARKFVESATARLAAHNRTEEDLSDLNQLIGDMQTAIDRNDDKHFNRLDIVFHKSVSEASKNHILTATYNTIHDILTKYITTSNMSHQTVLRSYRHHVKIVDAIRLGDESAARELMEHHVEVALQNLLERMGNS